jgi:hypothetical protein
MHITNFSAGFGVVVEGVDFRTDCSDSVAG